MSLPGVYIHIPFCKSRCSYCDFATDVYRDSGGVERYVSALCREIATASFLPGTPPFRNGSDLKPRIDTLYFGGGTPSLLTPKQLERILVALKSRFTLIEGTEITIEMNPATVTPATLAAFRSLGINRASFGVQTFDDTALKLLARGHDANDARNTFTMLREAGFDNVSLDLIGGLPGQSLENWQQNLEEALRMEPEHLSLYLLEVNEGTPLAEQIRSGRQPMPNEELAAEMYELMLDRLAVAGYEQYEIANFSKPGRRSRHNSKYWTLDPIFAFGVSAHSFDGHQRYANERDTAKYVEMIESGNSAEVMREDIDRASEHIFLGLRMEGGIDLADHERQFGEHLLDKYLSDLERLRDAELIDIANGRIFLTRKGKLFSNEVFTVFV